MKKELSLSQLAYLTFYVILLLALGKTFASCDIRTGTYTLGWGCSDAVSCARSVASAIGAYVISIQMNGENSFTATFLVKQAEGAADCGCLEAQKTLGTFTQEGNLINAGSHNMPQNPSCGDAAFDSTVNPIIGTSCYELGDINPDKPPVINGVTITSGKWVYVTLHRTTNSGGPMSDTSFKTVTSHGCSDISENGINLTKGNARDTTFNQDGVTLHGCNYNGKMLSGSCSQNNLDTSCGGAVPVNYNSANDSILNNCKFGNPSIDSTQKSKRDTVSLHGDSALSTTQFGIGANGIIEAQGKTTDAIGTSNGLLGDIKNAINSGFNAVTGLLGSILNKPVNVGDTSAFDTT
ncbi:MAG TPA: hypothetical protein VMR41_04125, partial [Patescibacteria group bacterium]|nr:hypothetical protein [Patescibacteria group bacterium]